MDPGTREKLVNTYTSGMCHVLAVALHRKLGWEIVLALNPDANFWDDPDDPDNGIPDVYHVYAVSPSMEAWDVTGSRPSADIRSDVAQRFDADAVDTEWMRSEDELRTYVGEWADEGEDPIDRPLVEYSQEQVEQAWRHAQALFPTLCCAPPRPAPRPAR